MKNKIFKVFTLDNSLIETIPFKFMGTTAQMTFHFARMEFINNTNLKWVSQDAFGGIDCYDLIKIFLLIFKFYYFNSSFKRFLKTDKK